MLATSTEPAETVEQEQPAPLLCALICPITNSDKCPPEGDPLCTAC